ncbi:MauE/DoxX family redox-associated membrane protein [Flavobacterium anhuiense]|uniref:MauE/DoxX family redox-associated membrane protein n=1 Tax=Flavobacterium anhuiense TaxID=459526 RepID=UPI003D99AB4A
MRLSSRTRYYISETICLLYILLFIYASASKLMDFQHFRIQLGQSPLLSAFADQLAVVVPLSEIIICVLLFIPKYKPAGLFAAYGLMLMFTAYIIIILNYTSFVPCSCGGVLEKLGWKEHLIFNLFFIVLSIIALMLYIRSDEKRRNLPQNMLVKMLFPAISVCSISLVVILFLLSENIVHYHNKLTRRFPHSPIRQTAILDLKVNSFYFAGVDGNTVYLGNITAPLMVTTLNRNLVQTKVKMIDLNRKDLPFRGVRVTVQNPYFFVADGTVPCIFRGKTSDWKAELVLQKGEYFGSVLPIDSSALAVATYSKTNGDKILGLIELGKKERTVLNPDMLQKQFDGVFDTDGHLLYSAGMQKIIYLYAYRNQFTIADRELNIKERGSTIDTIKHAKLSVSKDAKHMQRQLSKPPLFVNKSSAVCKNLLFVNSAVPGRFEDDRMWKRTSIIDVYDLNQKSYLLSFTINNLGDKKLKSFMVYDDQLYALIGNHIIAYKIDVQITSKYK